MKSLRHLSIQATCHNRQIAWPRNAIITGPNGTGKTSLIRSIQFLLTGDWGPYKQAGDIAKFGRDGNLYVSGAWDGITVARRIETMDGKSSQEIDIIPYAGKDRQKEQEEYIALQLGSFAPMLDLGAFIGLSDAERIKLLFSMMDSESAKSKLSGFFFDAMGEMEKSEHCPGDLYRKAQDSPATIDGIESFLSFLADQRKECSAVLKRNEQAAQQFQRELLEINAPLTALNVLQDERSDLIKQRQIAEGEKKQAEERQRQYRNAQDLLIPKQRKLQAEQLLKIQNGQLAEMEQRVSKRAEWEQLQKEANEELSILVEREVATRNLITEQGRLCDSLRDGKCPLSGQPCDVSQDSFDAADAKREVKILEHQEISEKKQDCVSRLETIHNALVEIDAVEKDIDANTRRTLAILDLQKEIATLTDQVNEIGTIQNPAEISTLIQALTIQINEHDSEIAAVSKRDNLHGLIDKNLAERKELEETLEFLKDLIEFAGPKGLLGKLIQDTIGETFTIKINEILAAIDGRYGITIEYQRNERMVLNFIFQGRDFDVLSTGEKALVGMAIQAALIEIADPPFKLFALDNLEALDEENRQGLIEAVDRIKDRFSNCVLAGCCRIDAPGGWERIEL